MAETIIADGFVQRAGFGRYAEKIARGIGVVGSVQNLDDGTVRIFAEAKRPKLESFVEKIKSAPRPIEVKDIGRRESKVRASVSRFRIKVGSLASEMMEGFGAMESQFTDYREEFRDYRIEFRGLAARTDENFSSLVPKYGEISDRLTQILELLRTENRDAINSLNESVKALLRAVERLERRDEPTEEKKERPAR